MHKLKSFFIAIFCLLFVVSCGKNPEPVEYIEKVGSVEIDDGYLTQGELAVLVSQTLDLNKIKESSNYKAIDFSGQYSSLENWIKESKEAFLVKKSSDKAEIKEFISLNLPSFPFFPDETWNPSREITRGKFSRLLLDILIVIQNNDSMLSEFDGQKSPYLDVKESSIYFPAIMVSSSRGLIQAYKLEEGKFEAERLIKKQTAKEALQKLNQYYF